MRAPLRVRVPATSANLGPGFDALGLALSLYDDVVVRVTDEPGLSVDVAGMGAASVPRNGRHLVVEAMRATLQGARRCAPRARGGVRRTASRTVAASGRPRPRSSPASSRRGRWSSAARNGSMTTRSLALAARLEGHADNVAACLLGGAHDRLVRGGRRRACPRRRRPIPRWRRSPSCPGSSSSTKAARRLLPDAVPHADAARNAGARRAAGRGAAARVRISCSPRPRTGCTRTTERPRCRVRAALIGRAACRRDRRRSCPAPVRPCWPSRPPRTASAADGLSPAAAGAPLPLDVERAGAGVSTL